MKKMNLISKHTNLSVLRTMILKHFGAEVPESEITRVLEDMYLSDYFEAMERMNDETEHSGVSRCVVEA